MKDEDIEFHEKAIENLLDRAPPQGYTQELTDNYAQEFDATTSQVLSPYFIFRLDKEWLGITIKVLKGVVSPRPVHRIPHRTNRILRGTVNIEGQFKLLVTLENIFDTEQNKKKIDKDNTNTKLFIFGQGNEEWVIEAVEVMGIRHLDLEQMQNVPVNLLHTNSNFLKGIIDFEGNHIGILEEDLLFYSLKRSLR